MQAQDVVEYMLESVKNRKEIFDIGIDRGQNEGMQIEKWLLIEMLSKLKELKVKGVLSSVEGEHKYEEKKTSRYEHCDLWWKECNQEHWLEVKTIVYGTSQHRGNYLDICKDIEKTNRINTPGIFHHLSFLFPVDLDLIEERKKELDKVYGEKGFLLEKTWFYKIWPDKSLLIVLYKLQ